MATVYVGKDERYPDYFMSSNDSIVRAIELSDEEVAQVEAADKAYSAAQAILARAWKASHA